MEGSFAGCEFLPGLSLQVQVLILDRVGSVVIVVRDASINCVCWHRFRIFNFTLIFLILLDKNQLIFLKVGTITVSNVLREITKIFKAVAHVKSLCIE